MAVDKEEGKEEEEVPRVRVGETRHTGIVIDWRGHYGWIHPFGKVDHEQATKHYGRIYIKNEDVVQAEGLPIKEGRIVDFYPYADGDGLGADECRPRAVLRLTLPHSEANKIVKDKSQWSEYLTASDYYPSFEQEHGVLLRKYQWPLPFALFELWGHPDELANAVVALVAKGEDDSCYVRLLLPEDAIPKIKDVPSDPKVSDHIVVSEPVPCRSLTIQTTKEKCKEAVKAFVLAMVAK